MVERKKTGLDKARKRKAWVKVRFFLSPSSPFPLHIAHSFSYLPTALISHNPPHPHSVFFVEVQLLATCRSPSFPLRCSKGREDKQ